MVSESFLSLHLLPPRRLRVGWAGTSVSVDSLNYYKGLVNNIVIAFRLHSSSCWMAGDGKEPITRCMYFNKTEPRKRVASWDCGLANITQSGKQSYHRLPM